MNIQFETPERLKIQLTATDLKELGTSYSRLDYASADTRQLLDDLLDRIGAKKDFSVTDRRLVIEIFPDGKEGCTIYLTLASPILPKRRLAECSVAVWEFEDADSLIDALFTLRPFLKEKASLYLLEKRYRLAVSVKKGGSADMILSEFAQKIGGKSALLHTLEHWQLISDKLSPHTRP